MHNKNKILIEYIGENLLKLALGLLINYQQNKKSSYINAYMDGIEME